MRVLKIDRTVFDVGFDSDWNKLMNSYNAKGFEKMEFIGTLHLSSNYLNRKIYNSFPTNLHVHGQMSLSRSLIENLPKILYVDAGLYMNNTNVKELPGVLNVEGVLDIRDTLITKLPVNAIIKGEIHFPDVMIKNAMK